MVWYSVMIMIMTMALSACAQQVSRKEETNQAGTTKAPRDE